MGKMFGLGEIIISKIMEFIDTIFCLKNKLIKLESTNTPQVFEAFTSLNNCIRLSFICFIIFLIMNIYSIYNNYSTMNDKCSFSYICMMFLSFMKSDSEIYLFVWCLIIYITIMFVYILYLMIRFFINKSETNFIDDTYVLSKLLFTSPSLRLNHPEDRVNFRQYLIDSIFNIRQSFKK